MPWPGRSLHDDEPGPAEMFQEVLGDNPSHNLVRLPIPLFPDEHQREGERVGYVLGSSMAWTALSPSPRPAIMKVDRSDLGWAWDREQVAEHRAQVCPPAVRHRPPDEADYPASKSDRSPQRPARGGPSARAIGP